MVLQITLTLSWAAIAAFISFIALIIAAINLLMKVNKNHKLLMDSKVDVAEYEKHCIRNDTAFKEIRDTQTKQLDKINLTLDKMFDQNLLISTQQVELKTDIEWIKKKL